MELAVIVSAVAAGGFITWIVDSFRVKRDILALQITLSLLLGALHSQGIVKLPLTPPSQEPPELG